MWADEFPNRFFNKVGGEKKNHHAHNGLLQHRFSIGTEKGFFLHTSQYHD